MRNALQWAVRGLWRAVCLGGGLALGACAASPGAGAPPSPAAAVPQTTWGPEAGDVVLGVAAGVTGSPDTFLTGAQVDYFLGDHLSLGPGVYAGLSDDDTLVATTFHVRWQSPLDDHGDLSRVFPFAQFGAGFLYAEKERRNRSDRDDIGVLLQGGLGMDFAVSDDVTFGTAVTLNLMPADVVGEHAYVAWEVLRVGFRF